MDGGKGECAMKMTRDTRALFELGHALTLLRLGKLRLGCAYQLTSRIGADHVRCLAKAWPEKEPWQ